MSEMSFEQMLEESFKTIRNGEVVEGTVIDVKPDEIILNIGYKSDGIITRNEYTNETNVDLTTMVSVGDTMEAKVLKVNDGEGQVLLTYKRLAAERGSKRLEEAFNNQEVLTAKVAQVLDGGLSVIIDESRVFIPASLVSDSYEKDLTKYNGQDIEFVITEFTQKGMDCDLEAICEDIAARDERDMNRAASPLRQAEDAVLLESSELGIEEVTSLVVGYAKERMRKGQE